MEQLTRDLYTSGKVWLSLSHNFTYSKDKNSSSTDLVKVSGDFVTLNAGALFILTLWPSTFSAPSKFLIPEHRIEYFRSILSALYDLKKDPEYVNVEENTLTEKGRASSLYYRLALANKKYIDVFFVENDYNGEKTINIAIESEGESYFMYDSSVLDMIDVIPNTSELARYKQDAAQLYYLEKFILGGASANQNTYEKTTVKKSTTSKKNAPRQITEIDRTSVSEPASKPEKVLVEAIDEEPIVKKPSNESVQVSKSGVDYSKLLEDN